MSVEPQNKFSDRRATALRPRSVVISSIGTPLAPAGGDNLPPWQVERARILQKACQRIKGRTDRGQELLRNVRIVARSLDGRAFKTDPARRLKLTAKTLLRLFYAWRANGGTAAVFRFRYTCRHSLFTNLVMARFADFLMTHPQRSFQSNWNIFSSRRSNFRGRWRPAKRAVQAATTKAGEIAARVQAVSTFPK